MTPVAPEPLWIRTGPPIPVDREHVLHPDVVVAGAGLTGLATAAVLARAGRRVAVCEARTVGAVATGNTTAKLSLLQGSVYGEIRAHASVEALRAYAAAQRAGADWLRAVAEHVDGALRDEPAFTFSTTDEGDAALEREAEALEASGVDAVWGPTEQTGLPFAVSRALRMEGQAALHPRRVLAALAAELRSRGGTIVEGCRVTGLEDAPDGVGVATTRGVLAAAHLVVATGSPAIDRAGFFARLEPSRSVVGAYAVDGPLPEGMHLSVDPQARSLRTADDGAGGRLLLVGGGGFRTGRGDAGAMLADIDAWTAEAFPGARRVTWWAAQDYRTITRLPFAGAEPGTDGRVLTATGYDKWGMANGAAAALAMAGEILGERPSWVDGLRSPQVGVRDAATAVGANARVAKEMASGWTKALVSRDAEPPAEGEGRVETRGAHPVAVSRVDGRLCAVSGVCTHLGGILQWNPAERSWDCPLHASRFDPEGRVLEGPATKDLARMDDAPAR
ncbi:FAD-dependent oxidoreductase [Microbacterium barkeri]|uniref:FAD-dependent oxidoreductase n=1 Tax=Microbacterium barkeri TaxID=33917 RepID=UPI0024AF7B59|nr:FAD-dependent oxidoreductase [Microbacterium barkeri]MDI6944802.1 FAD-dependent oxidoreductase [Microbacterium barkeri]